MNRLYLIAGLWLLVLTGLFSCAKSGSSTGITPESDTPFEGRWQFTRMDITGADKLPKDDYGDVKPFLDALPTINALSCNLETVWEFGAGGKFTSTYRSECYQTAWFQFGGFWGEPLIWERVGNVLTGTLINSTWQKRSFSIQIKGQTLELYWEDPSKYKELRWSYFFKRL